MSHDSHKSGTPVFLLQHLHYNPPGDPAGEDEAKIIGIYSSMETAMEAYDRAKILPGFCDYPELVARGSESLSDQGEGFYIDLYPLDGDYWLTGFVSI